jgi:nitrogen fixation-related uncharacterized protein
MNPSTKLFLAIWLIYTFIMLIITAIVFVWAFKHRQFKDQGHASKLPLEIEDDFINLNLN